MSEWIESASEAELLDYLARLIEQARSSRDEQILRLLESIHEAQIEMLEAQREIELAYSIEHALAPPPSRTSWLGLALAGVIGYWLGGGFSGDD